MFNIFKRRRQFEISRNIEGLVFDADQFVEYVEHQRLADEAREAEAEVEAPRSTYELTRDFHEAFGHPVRETPGTTDAKTAALRIALILEELEELASATFPNMGAWDVACALEEGDIDGLIEEYDPDLVEIADAYADLDVVVNGGALVHGLPMPELAEEVYNSNMSKAWPDGEVRYREDGKILKGPDFAEPDIEAVLLGRM